MPVQLTKDTDKFVCVIYKRYLELRKFGADKSAAGHFPQIQELRALLFPNTSVSDLVGCISEAGKAFNMYVFIDGSFDLNDEIILYMENRFKNGLLEVVSFLAQFIP